jgi:uncharacterized protein (DUF1684 family)
VKTVLLALIAVVLAPQAGYHAEIDKYRADRITELTAPDGWLAVRGLFWLHDGANVAGSDPASAIVLPSRAPKRLGTFTLDKGSVAFAAEPGATVTAGGKSVTEYTFTRADGSAIQFSGITISAIRRADKVGLRMWDPESPHRTAFKGLTYFPLDPAYRFNATFVPYDTPKKVPVPNVLGQLVQMESPGYVQFTIGGTQYKLEPVYETSKHEDLFFIFKDLTSRTETYEAGRFLHTPLPKNGIVDLDFNRAYNPPCAFTEFATCPLPVKDNQLPIRIPAGELRYHVTDR